jgi:hypothetical protein
MAEGSRSNRPTPRTAAAAEAELRRRIRGELTQARAEAHNGEIEDSALADIIARAVASALSWHLDAPEHTRNATLSSRSWRPSAGPRGGRRPSGGVDEQPEEPEPRARDYNRPPRGYDRPPREYDRAPRGQREYDREPREFDRSSRGDERGRRDFDRGPRAPRGGGGFSKSRQQPRGRR